MSSFWWDGGLGLAWGRGLGSSIVSLSLRIVGLWSACADISPWCNCSLRFVTSLLVAALVRWPHREACTRRWLTHLVSGTLGHCQWIPPPGHRTIPWDLHLGHWCTPWQHQVYCEGRHWIRQLRLMFPVRSWWGLELTKDIRDGSLITAAVAVIPPYYKDKATKLVRSGESCDLRFKVTYASTRDAHAFRFHKFALIYVSYDAVPCPGV